VPDGVAEALPVVVLAGGLGTRMRALTAGLPKSLVQVAGEPFAFHQLRLLASQGARKVLYVIGYEGDRIRSALGDGSAFGVAVSYVDEGEELHGTGGALRVAHDRGVLPDAFGLLYGDSYLPLELGSVWAAFDASELPALMTVHRNEDRWDRSNTVLEGDRVVLYDKRPEARDGRMAWIDYGFSVLRREVIEEIPSGAVVDLADVYRDLSRTGRLAGLEVSDRFYEAGSPGGVAELERYLLER
jgi:NDP-sugar pyrophosphorylase family protein